MHTILIARHGQTRANKLDIFQGQINNELTDLTDLGREHARRLAEYCKKYPIEIIYSSPLKRARITAEAVASHLALKIMELDALKECCYGAWEGKTKVELEKIYAKEFIERAQDKYNFIHPGRFIDENGDAVPGESYAMVYERASKFLNKLKEDKNIKAALLVTHVGIVRIALRYFLKLSEQEVAKIDPPNDELYEVSLDGGSIKVKSHKF